MLSPLQQPPKIAYVLGCFPDNTPTFVFNEMVGLYHLGFDITIFSIHKSVTNKNHLDYKTWLPKTVYADPLYSLPITLSHLYFMFVRPVIYFKLLFQHKEFGGKRAFWEGVYFSRIIQKIGIKHVHAHFAWKTADVARLISSLTGVPFSFTVHAADIYCFVNNLKAKLEEAKFVLTCVKNNKTYISRKFGKINGQKIVVVYHGVDLKTFTPLNTEDKLVDILCIGNLVEKKGHRYLIEACGILKKKGVSLKCLIIGEGPEKDYLINMIKSLKIEDSIDIEGRRPQAELPSVYAKSKVFALPSIITDSGDRDGIPNVLTEAMAMGLPVVSSNVPNISELIEHDKDGISVREKDPEALADALEELLNDSNKRAAIGKMARKKIKNKFDAKKHLQTIAKIFSETINVD